MCRYQEEAHHRRHRYLGPVEEETLTVVRSTGAGGRAHHRRHPVPGAGGGPATHRGQPGTGTPLSVLDTIQWRVAAICVVRAIVKSGSIAYHLPEEFLNMETPQPQFPVGRAVTPWAPFHERTQHYQLPAADSWDSV
jgi:hypothetical protein